MADEVKEKKPVSVCGIVGIVLAVVALITSPMPIINNGSFILGLIGVVFAIIGLVGAIKGKKGGKVVSIIGLALAVVACAVVLVTQSMYSAALDQAQSNLDKMTGDATEELLKSDVEVTIGSLSLAKGNYGLIESELPIVIVNKAKEPKSYNVHIEAVDAQGARIADDYAYVNSLGSGQMENCKCFKYISSDLYDDMAEATFNIIEVSQY